MNCDHEQHEVKANVIGLTETEGGPITRYIAEIEIRCADECGQPFGFRGLPMGVSPRFPSCSVDSTELRAPLFTPSDLALASPIPLDDSALGITLELAKMPCLIEAPDCPERGRSVAESCLPCRARALTGG